MVIVFNINFLAFEGLGATLASICKNCSNTRELNFNFLCSDISKEDQEEIEHLLHKHDFKGTLSFIPFDAKKEFGHLRSLHGDWTAYGRLLIPELFSNQEHVVYLDTDLIINLDILDFKQFYSKDKPISAVPGCEVKWALERDFLINIAHVRPNAMYFNSGVLIFNIQVWNTLRLTDKWRNFPSSYYPNFKSADQTVLNILIAGDFLHLPNYFNNAWFPGKEEPSNMEYSIIHFVGSPKPWDFFGKTIHKGHGLFNYHNPLYWKKKYNGFTKGKLLRTNKIKKSIIKHLIKKIKK